MSVKYFTCSKCENTCILPERLQKTDMQCGVLVGYIINGDGDEVPYGCGGTMTEVTYEEALNIIPRG